MLHINKALLAAECEALLYRWDVCAYRCTAARRTSLRCLSQFGGSSRFCSRLTWSFISEALFHQVVNKINTCFHIALQKRWVNNVKRNAAENRTALIHHHYSTWRRWSSQESVQLPVCSLRLWDASDDLFSVIWLSEWGQSDQYLWKRFSRELEAELSTRTRKKKNQKPLRSYWHGHVLLI